MLANTRPRQGLLSPRALRITMRVLLYVFLALGSIIMFFPFVWMVITSFKSYAEAIAVPPTLLPGDWGPRLRTLGQMILLYPLTLLAFAAWTALGVWFTRRIPDQVVGVLTAVLWVAAFFWVANLPFLGTHRLGEVYNAAMKSLRFEFPSITENYVESWQRAPFALYFRNSIIMSVFTPLLIIVTAAPAAYAFARLRFPAKDLLFMIYLATMMVPSEVVLIPNFVTISELGWKNTFAGLIVPSAVSVMSIFFLRQFFLSIPNDLFDAAVIDGAGHGRFLLSIAMPLSRPALVSTGMFNFLGAWNALLWPLLVTDKANMRPITLGLAAFSTEAGSQPQLYMAAATFSTVPVLILFLFVQKQFIEGIARTGIK
jgi:ABC-type glycerol-3-phosphate transport system permease component